MFKQGPYWVEPVGGSLRCVPRRGTFAWQRQQRRIAEQKESQEIAVFIFVALGLVLAFVALSAC